ncbi:IclR family transcriptional regulator [Rhodococcus maanshanensis]|uniref:Glycerol operon regulatory protein n=1 Tax=Rhodococcus maanshanensis TaxID=183556 RepID=A0A1H7PSC1_9NOCA|nr:IclR family transcriptional regulator [Rhodococcus maanshanensis]SEL38155.1 DNA-binding transcriptional regulator, IclR family [Rhodococcus maanshanensis]
METPSDPNPSATGSVQTVARALSVLGCFRGGDELGVSEVARLQGLAVSTTHRLLTALVDAGFLDKDAESSRYRLGGALAEYGQIAYRQHRIYLAEPHLEQLATTTGASASIATRYGNDAVLLGTSRWREADGHQLQGVRLPLHASALGKALLAWSQVTDDELGRLPYETGTARSVPGPLELGKELALTRERGYAFNDEELAAGYRTIGVPIVGDDGLARFALGLRGPTELMIAERVPFFVELARVTAREIAAVMQ